MCIRKVVVSVLLLPLLGLTILKAQEIPAAAGGNGTGSTGSISYSFGQVFYTSAKGVGGELEEGVQHAYEIYLLPDPPAWSRPVSRFSRWSMAISWLFLNFRHSS